MEDNEEALFDGVMREVGMAGRFQRRFNLVFNLVLVVFATMSNLNLVFAMAVPAHWCHVPGRERANLTLHQWKSITLPRENNSRGVETFDNCNMYNWSEPITEELLNRSKEDVEIIGCRDGWDYDRTWYTSTAPSQQSWVCDRELRVTNTFVASQAGDLVGSFVFGQLGDMHGDLGARPELAHRHPAVPGLDGGAVPHADDRLGHGRLEELPAHLLAALQRLLPHRLDVPRVAAVAGGARQDAGVPAPAAGDRAGERHGRARERRRGAAQAGRGQGDQLRLRQPLLQLDARAQHLPRHAVLAHQHAVVLHADAERDQHVGQPVPQLLLAGAGRAAGLPGGPRAQRPLRPPLDPVRGLRGHRGRLRGARRHVHRPDVGVADDDHGGVREVLLHGDQLRDLPAGDRDLPHVHPPERHLRGHARVHVAGHGQPLHRLPGLDDGRAPAVPDPGLHGAAGRRGGRLPARDAGRQAARDAARRAALRRRPALLEPRPARPGRARLQEQEAAAAAAAAVRAVSARALAALLTRPEAILIDVSILWAPRSPRLADTPEAILIDVSIQNGPSCERRARR
ncbi:uncharacterized protein LOC134533859 isoform X1 [Bacillus rossius redtenbacheri]|uniref:uncharacterized protein LOC134533859 isoform X1 n=1 Tax=Bacillus rossius redtenbacheri TaxID=93214 RepID=UPI002FDE8DF5